MRQRRVVVCLHACVPHHTQTPSPNTTDRPQPAPASQHIVNMLSLMQAFGPHPGSSCSCLRALLPLGCLAPSSTLLTPLAGWLLLGWKRGSNSVF